MSPFASTTSILQISSYMNLHKVYPTVCKNSKGRSWQDHLGSVILKLSTILKATTHHSNNLKLDPEIQLSAVDIDWKVEFSHYNVTLKSPMHTLAAVPRLGTTRLTLLLLCFLEIFRSQKLLNRRFIWLMQCSLSCSFGPTWVLSLTQSAEAFSEHVW